MRTKKHSSICALLLALAMMFSLTVPTFAATTSEAIVMITQDGTLIDASARTSDGNKDILTVGALEVESLTVNGVAISQADIAKTQSAASNMSVNGKDMTAGSYKVYTDQTNGVKTVRLSWSNLTAALDVQLTTKAHPDFAVNVSCAPAASCVFSSSQEQTVVANGTYSMTITPKATQLEVESILVKAGGLNKTVKVPTSGSTSVDIAGQTVTVTLIKDGIAQVDITHVSQDTELVAQVRNVANKYTVTVSIDANCSSNVASEVVEEGASKTITLTPSQGYNVSDIVISVNGKSETIQFDKTSTALNGQTFSVERQLDGSAVLTIPAMKADVDVYANASDDIYTINVVTGSYATSEKAGVSFVSSSAPFVLTLEPKRNAAIMSLKVTTASGTYRADADDDYMFIYGTYNRIYTDRDGSMTIYFYELNSNMKIEVEARETIHDVAIYMDSHVKADKKDTTIDDGKDMTVSFTPDEGYSIRTVRAVYNGVAYSVDPTASSYIRVDGIRWPVVTDANGTVTLTMKNVMAGINVLASTRKNASFNINSVYYVSKSIDSHSHITVTGGTSFRYGQSADIHVYTDKDYVIKSVVFSTNGKSVTVDPFDTEFTLDGERYTVTWDTDTDCYVNMNVYGSITVRATSVKGEPQSDNGAKYKVTTSADSRSKITVTPSYYKYAAGQAVAFNVTVTPKNYVLKNFRLTMNGKSVTVEPFTTSATLDGQLVSIVWTSNRAFEVNLCVTGDLSIATTTVLGTEEQWVGVPGDTSANHFAYMSGYPGGLFGPTDNMTRAEAITIVCSLYRSDVDFSRYTGYAASYTDVTADLWYSGFVGYAKVTGMLNKLTTDAALKPYQPITRAELLSLLFDFGAISASNVSVAAKYSDVPSSHWAVKYINCATERGWVSGIGNGLFEPDRSITRAEVCAMVNRITGRIPNGAYATYTNGFSDVAPNAWYYSDIMEATNGHTITGIQNGVEIWSH